jgi:hypothetical protein
VLELRRNSSAFPEKGEHRAEAKAQADEKVIKAAVF